MKFRRPARRLAVLLAGAAMLLATCAATLLSPSTASASTSAPPSVPGTGWIRMAHLSPDTPAMDLYLYSFTGSGAKIVLHHVTYGTVSSYQSVTAGDYSVAMRPAGAPATSQPVLSASVTVAAGHAYTAAALGPRSAIRLQVISDDLTAPAGRALVRVIQASLKQRAVTVTWDGKSVASSLPLASVTPYQAVSPGTERVTVTGQDEDASATVTLAPGSIDTLVVLDGARGLEIDSLTDAAGSARAPAGGAATGFGGTAPHGPASPLPWLAVIGFGLLIVAGGGQLLVRRSRQPRPEA
jgi:Domain of unknown function (DUF4397)